MRKLLVNIAVVATSTVLTVGLIDAGLWLIAPINHHESPTWQPDGHIRGRYVPGQLFETGPSHNPLYPVRDSSFENRINRYGFRGPDFELDGDPGTVRIAIFGGSAAFNFHDPEDETWPQRLGACLSDRLGGKTEVLNFALPGFDLGISKVNYLINGRVFEPDIAIAYHTWNDLKAIGRISGDADELLVSRVAEPAGYPTRIARGLSRYSQIVRRARVLYYQLKAGEREGTSVESAWGPASQRAEHWFRSNFTDFINFTRSDNVIPIVATQGTIVAEDNLDDSEVTQHISVEMVGLSLDDLLDLWRWANDTIVDVADQHGVLSVDVYSQLPHSMTYLEDHVHLAPEGQIRVAEIFCQAMAASPDVRAAFARRTLDDSQVPGGEIEQQND